MANNTKAINIKITESAPGAGPFNILDESGNVLKDNVSLDDLVSGIALNVPTNDISISITSSGNCTFNQYVPLKEIENEDWVNSEYATAITGCLWTHLKNTSIYNYYYGNIEPYIIEYPFSYKYHDDILQDVKDNSKVYYYLTGTPGAFATNKKIQVDNQLF